LVDLTPMEQQLPAPFRIVVVAIALLERRDVRADQPRLALLDAGIGVGDVHLAGADRLDLGAGQHETGLERLVDAELVAGSSVECDGRVVAHGMAPYCDCLSEVRGRSAEAIGWRTPRPLGGGHRTEEG